MATSPLQFHPTYYDDAVRQYLQALQRGEHPQRPECGHWASTIDDIEHSVSNGAPIDSVIRTLVTSGKCSDLAVLLGDSFDISASSTVSTPGKLSLVESSKTGDPLVMPTLPEIAQLSPDLSKGACQWLDTYISYSKAVSPESYEDFHESCGVWLLSTIAGRRLKIPFRRRQYTPLMLVLVADTTMTAKTESALVAIDVLQASSLRFLLGSDETTPQKLLSDMTGQYVPKNYAELGEDKQYWEKQRLAMAAQRGWYYDEFGSLIRAMTKQGGAMSDFKGLLLKLDGCADTYEYSTHSRGRETIDKPYLAFLGSMTSSDMKINAKSGSDFWSDGFWARFAFVCPPAETMLDKPFELGELPVPPALSNPLYHWHHRLGMPGIDIETKTDDKDRVTGYEIIRAELPETSVEFADGVYEAWVHYRSALKQMVIPVAMKDFRGSYGRLPIKAIRLAALFASLENNNVIEMRHWAKAQEIAERWRKSLHELYRQVNHSELEPSYAKRVEEKVLRCVEKLQGQGKPPTVRDLSRYIKEVDVGRLKIAVVDLQRAGLLVEQKSAHGVRYSTPQASEDG